VVADEVSVWANRGLWDSLVSSVAKRGDSLLVAIGNAGWATSWQWETREIVRRDDGWYFNALPGCVASWIGPRALQEQERLLPPAVFARVWGNKWSDGSGDAIPGEWLSRALTLAGPAAERATGWVYCAGVDLGLKSDFAAAAVIGRHVGHAEKIGDGPPQVTSRLTAILRDIGGAVGLNPSDYAPKPEPAKYRDVPGSGKLRLVALRIWKPDHGEIDLSQVESELLRLNERFRLRSVLCDDWQCAHLRQRLAKGGLRIEGVSFSGGILEMLARELLDSLRDSRLELWPEPTLLADLRNATLVERSYGVRLQSPRARGQGHGDSLTALTLALLAASRIKSGPPRVTRRLLVG
jgi:hypothetical protein